MTTQKLQSLKVHVIHFMMHVSFLRGLKVSSHCKVLPYPSRVARKFCACHVSLLVLIISFNDILDLDRIQRQAVSEAQFFSQNIDIVLLDHIQMMAVTVALIQSLLSLQLLMNSSLAILSNSLIYTPAGRI